MSDKSESTYVWRRINRAKLALILDDDGDWVANPNISNEEALRIVGQWPQKAATEHLLFSNALARVHHLAMLYEKDRIAVEVAAALTPGVTNERV